MKNPLGILLLFLILPLAACDSNSTELYHRVAPSIVQVITPGAANEPDVVNGTGTGFFIEHNLIVTNRHVVGDRILVQVKLHQDNRLYQARVIGTTALDLALLQITSADWLAVTQHHGVPAALPWRLHSLPQPGEQIWSLGNPLGMHAVFTTGIVSLNYKFIPGMGLMLLTDSTILPGNSGGPLLDSRGRVVGVSTAIFNGSELPGVGNTFGAAVPAAIASRAAEQILARAPVTVNQLCVEISSDKTDHYVKLTSVRSNGPAWLAGLAPGDQLVAYKFERWQPITHIHNVDDLLWMLHSTAPKSTVWFLVQRNGHRKMISVNTVIREIDPKQIIPMDQFFGWGLNIPVPEPADPCAISD